VIPTLATVFRAITLAELDSPAIGNPQACQAQSRNEDKLWSLPRFVAAWSNSVAPISSGNEALLR